MMLFLESGGPVDNQRQWRGKVCGQRIDQEVAIWGHVILEHIVGGSDDTRLKEEVRHPCSFHARVKARSHQFSVRLYVENLPAVVAPARLSVPTPGNLDPTSGAWKWLDGNPGVGNPSSVWGKLCFRASGREWYDFLVFLVIYLERRQPLCEIHEDQMPVP